jgi:hypothetical protein
MKQLDYNKTENEYIDIYNKVTHLEFSKNGSKLCLPIKPKNTQIGYKYIPNITIEKVNLKVLLNLLERLDKITDDTYQKYLENNEITKNYYFFQDMSYLPITQSKETTNYDNRVDTHLKLTGDIRPNEVDKYMEEYYLKRNKKDQMNINYLFYLRNNKSKLRDTLRILDNDIMLKIHKRERIYRIMKKYKKDDTQSLYPFIERLLINGYDKLQDILINNFTIKDITKENEEVYIFKDFQIKNKEYLFIFDERIKESNFIRRIDKSTRI